jgi:hypothetical protein
MPVEPLALDAELGAGSHQFGRGVRVCIDPTAQACDSLVGRHSAMELLAGF